MKNKRLIVLVLCTALMLFFLSACGGGKEAATADSEVNTAGSAGGAGSAGRAESAAGAGMTAGSGFNAEDFYGVWEYQESYNWICIYGDGTYEWYNDSGLTDGGTYTIEGVELHLDGLDLFYCLDGQGGMIDSDGENLFMSELPGENGIPENDGLGGSDPGDYGVIDFATAADFDGTWESTTENRWLVIYSDGVWTQYYYDGSYDSGYYYIEEGELYFDTLNDRYFLNDDGYMEEYDGSLMFRSEVPQYILEGGSDPGDTGLIDPAYGSDPGDTGLWVDESIGYNAEDYYGTWAREDDSVYYTIYGDGTYKLTYFDGDFFHGDYWMDGSYLMMDNNNYLYHFGSGVMDQDGYPCYPSVEP